MLKRLVGTGVLSGLAFVTLSAENWPAWRGPGMNGISSETGLPVKWSTTENIAWKLPMPGRSGSTPIIWNETIFLNIGTADGSGELELWALNRNDGKLMWKGPIAGGNHIERKQNMSSPSPVTDGQTVWVMTGVGVLKAFDFKGKELWARDIQTDYGKFGLNWGYASSPLLHGGDLYVQVLHGMKTDDPSYLLRINGKTGKTVWRQERPTNARNESPDSYTTPALLQYGKNTEIVDHRGRCRDRPRSCDRQRALADGRAQSAEQRRVPHHCVAARGRRDRDSPDARATDARDQGRWPWRHHEHPPAVELRQRS